MGRIKKVGLFLLVSYIFLLSFWMFFGFGRYIYPEVRYNLTPFSTVGDFLSFDQFDTKTWVINLIGNIGVFVPFGILLPLVFQRPMAQLYIKFISGVLMLEMMQLLSRRGVFDVDDLLLNSVGFIIGYGIYKIVVTWINSKKGDYQFCDELDK